MFAQVHVNQGHPDSELAPGPNLEPPSSSVLRLCPGSEGASEVRLTERPEPTSVMPGRSTEGNQNETFPQDAVTGPFIKHLGGICRAPARSSHSAAQQLRGPRVPAYPGRPRAGAVAPRSRPSAHAPGAEALPARGGGVGGGGGSFRFALHPGSSFAAGDSFLRTLGGLRCRRTSVPPDHGVAQGAGGPGSPRGKDHPPS